ncbi:hypothetical protein N658DRAFT_514131 [Parathielavia hyrcaniae]|uniref:Zn(2)-C6 fungal-type domain-containing protein n=1 Tax=Parathielavia hyrcaniae TaxID=113614 RepID=A0AAN6T4Q7_9PEZI|nr:hypothetical protein N658DRAFT_514131 [Parathielavia hyrcaniae]
MGSGSHSGSISPRTVATPKAVQFVLVFQEAPYQARLPLRVSIYPHDTTDSIITTVKNFYGLYSGPGVSKGISFEDEDGNTLIARYENFHDHMTVHVRLIEEPLGPHFSAALNPARNYSSGDIYPLTGPPPADAPRPTSKTSRLRSPSPNNVRGRRSESAGTNTAVAKKGRSRSSKNRAQVNGDGHGDSFNGYSSSDGASVSTEKRNKEQLGTTDISVENIVEGGRRKRAKFESSNLPLYAPPLMPNAASDPSVSPARRIDLHRGSLPFIQSGQNPFSNPQPLPSPQAYSVGYAHPETYATPGSDNRRARGSFGPSGQGVGAVIMTPDPTVRSAVSEEDKDVALQLMWMSGHPRASTSTQDDTLSGKADAASSTGATSDAESGSEDDMPGPRTQKLGASGSPQKAFAATESHFAVANDSAGTSGEDVDGPDAADIGTMAAPPRKGTKLKANTLLPARAHPPSSHKPKSFKAAKPKAKKAVPIFAPTPAAAIPSWGPGSVDEEHPDLSTKPRCQRCRKSKKGCDRQRPCSRCRDAGIPAELCISEDEGNGRKGRYGRHMGVPLKKEDAPSPAPSLLPPAPIAFDTLALPELAPDTLDKNKKRKRV